MSGSGYVIVKLYPCMDYLIGTCVTYSMQCSVEYLLFLESLCSPHHDLQGIASLLGSYSKLEAPPVNLMLLLVHRMTALMQHDNAGTSNFGHGPGIAQRMGSGSGYGGSARDSKVDAQVRDNCRPVDEATRFCLTEIRTLQILSSCSAAAWTKQICLSVLKCDPRADPACLQKDDLQGVQL